MKKDDHQQGEPEKEGVRVEVPAEKKEGGGGGDGEKHKGYRRNFKGGRGGWKSDRTRARGHFKGRSSNFSRDFCRQEKAEDLYQASLAQKKDRVVSFDCRIRPKSELFDWLRQNKPSSLKRSDGIGYIAVLSENVATPLEEKFVTTDTSNPELLEVWQDLTRDPTCLITYSTIRNLARKYKVCRGKWLFSVEGTGKVDDLWWFLCSSVLASSEDAKLGCLAVKITPVQDVEEEGVKLKYRNSHMVSVYTRDFCDEDDVFEVEKRLRSIPIKCQMTYKPDLFTVLGIYRNNRFKLRPTIYSSQWHPKSHTSVIDSTFDMDWSYRGGAGDLREHAREFDKVVQDVGRLYVTQEKIIDDAEKNKGDERPELQENPKEVEEEKEKEVEKKILKEDSKTGPGKIEEREEKLGDAVTKPEEKDGPEDGDERDEKDREEEPKQVENDGAKVEEGIGEINLIDFVEDAIKVVTGAKKTEAEGN